MAWIDILLDSLGIQFTVASLYAGQLEEIFWKKATESSQKAVFLGSDHHFKWC